MGAPTASDLIEKAERACRSAQVLLDLGDVDGAANRAYYAIFDAAWAALLAANAPVKPDIAKTHRGLINAFGDYWSRTDRYRPRSGVCWSGRATFE